MSHSPVAVGADWPVALTVCVSNRSLLAALISKRALESSVTFGRDSQAEYIVSMTSIGSVSHVNRVVAGARIAGGGKPCNGMEWS